MNRREREAARALCRVGWAAFNEVFDEAAEDADIEEVKAEAMAAWRRILADEPDDRIRFLAVHYAAEGYPTIDPIA